MIEKESEEGQGMGNEGKKWKHKKLPREESGWKKKK